MDTMEQRERGTHNKSRYKKHRAQKMMLRIGMAICAAAFLAGAFIVGRELIEDHRAAVYYEDIRDQMQTAVYENSVTEEALSAPVESEDDTESSISTKPGMDFSTLENINSDIVGWLIADGTVIDYPVLHTSDNDYYLTHLYNRERNRAGSLFVDYRNTGLFLDRNTVIYGHNMKSGAMFNTLSYYKEQEYYDEFPTMKLYTPDGNYIIELFAGTVEDGNYEFVQLEFDSDEAFMDYVEGFRLRSTFASDVVISPDDRIVSLCTCSYENNNARFMLIGRLTEMN